jgi:cobalamin biosynthesis Mg chelatase CobN
MASDNSYEPGPSFVDNDRPTDRLTEMPAWLQTFAAQETDIDTGEDEVQKTVETTGQGDAHQQNAVPADLPDWLRDEPVEASHASSVGEAHTTEHFPDLLPDEDSNPDGFISEDDLPDWLRAFSDESPVAKADAPDVSRAVTPRLTAPAGSTMVRVPPVENIWLSSVERHALGPGGSLFAQLAANGSANAGVSHQSYSAYEAESTRPSTARQASVSRESQPQQAVSTAESRTEQPAPQSNSFRLLLLTLLIVMLVIAISVWQFS